MSTDTPHYAGHRARLRERLLKDSTALADYEILELLLGYALLRRDTKPLAKELLSRFGSIRGVLDALPAEMQQVGGVGEGVAALRLLLREMMARYAEAPMRERKVLCTPGCPVLPTRSSGQLPSMPKTACSPGSGWRGGR